MSAIVNDRDLILQAATIRVEAVALPPNVIVKPGQLGPGMLPAGVLTPTGVPFGQLAGQNSVNLGSQVVGALNAGNVSGLGALAMLSTVNAQTQVNNLGQLAFANQIAANQIGVGTLAAGVIYAGTIEVEKLVGTTILGKNVAGGSSVYVGGSSQGNSQVGMYLSGSSVGVLYVNGLFSAQTSGGVGILSTTASGQVNINGNLTGSIGSRVLLNDQLYNASMAIDGVTKEVQIRFRSPA